MNNAASVKHITECFVKPKYMVEESKLPYHLAPLDLFMLPFHYIQAGLLFLKPSHLNDREFSIHSFVESLKESLSLTLIHFYPLAGQLVLEIDEDKHESRVYVDCNKGPGARLIQAVALDITVSDILLPNDVPLVVRSFFDFNDEAVNYDGHTKPLLSVQVTELLDGVFIACSMSHCLADGASYWHFWNRWSEIHRANSSQICESRLPVHNRWFPDGHGLPIALPFKHRDEIVRESEAPCLREKIFHFSSKSIAKLKAKAIKESNNDYISSFQALCALVWRAMVRANSLSNDQIIYNYLLADARHRLDPPLPEYYFGNCIKALDIISTSGELIEDTTDLGCAAMLLHQAVANFNDKHLRDFVNEWLQSPYFPQHGELHNYNSITIEQSPRFDVYGNEFGLGKALGIRTGFASKGSGIVHAFPGLQGGGDVDLEICLPPDSMSALECDAEFLAFVSMQE